MTPLIERGWFNDRTVIINKKIDGVKGPSAGDAAAAHRNIDNDVNVQEFIKEQVLPEIK